MTRNGKIARLPAALREELNQRLLDGEQGQPLVEWLNSLPKVQAVLPNFGAVQVQASTSQVQVNLSEYNL